VGRTNDSLLPDLVLVRRRKRVTVAWGDLTKLCFAENEIVGCRRVEKREKMKRGQ
jgi:hypothetical protein